eukprot:3017018-Pleurochrysis_carterae.AAC.1
MPALLSRRLVWLVFPTYCNMPALHVYKVKNSLETIKGLEKASAEVDSPTTVPPQAVDLPKGMSTPPAQAKPRSHNLWKVKKVTPGGKHQVQVNKQTNRDVIAPVTPEDVTPRQRREQLYNIRKPERQKKRGRGRGRPRISQYVLRGDAYVILTYMNKFH